MFTRVILPSNGHVANFVGRDSGLGSAFGAMSAGPASVSVMEQPPTLQQMEPRSMIDGIDGMESGSRCSNVISQQTVKVVQSSITMPPAYTSIQCPVEEVPIIPKESLSNNSLPLESAMKPLKQCSLEPSLHVLDQFSTRNDHAVGDSELSLSRKGQNYLTNSEILYMSDSQTTPIQGFSGSEKREFSNLNGFNDALSDNLDYSVTVEPSDGDLDNIDIEPWEHKEEFRAKQYDLALISSENDLDEALVFSDILTNRVTLEDNTHPSICVLDQNTDLTHINSRFTHMEEALKRSTFMFLFITKDFCGDCWAQLQKDECLMESINNPQKKWCVIPILTKPRKEADYNLPFGLRALKGFEVYRLLRGKSLNSVDVSSLQEGDIDQVYCDSMGKMLSTRLALKRQREREQLVEFQKWLKEEKQRRWKTKRKEEFETCLNEKRRAAERTKLQQKLTAMKQKEIALIEITANRSAETEADVIMRNTRMKENRDYCPGNIETKSSASKPLLKETPTVSNHHHHHHHYYGTVKHTSDKHTTYNINGSVSESTIGNNNKLYKEESSGHVLKERNLLTETPADGIDYVVEVEENSNFNWPANVEQGKSLNYSSAKIVEDFCAGHMHRQGSDNETNSAADLRSPALGTSSSPDLMFQKKSELNGSECGLTESAKCSPEVDNPHSPLYESAKRNVQQKFEFAENERRRMADGTSSTRNVSPFVTNALNSGAGLSKPLGTSRSFSNESSSDRPVAAVSPVCQTSEPVSKTDTEETIVKVPFNEEEETVVKFRFQNEETRLKQAVVKLPCEEEINDEETSVKSQYCIEGGRIKQTDVTNISINANMEASRKQEVNSGKKSSKPVASVEIVKETFLDVEKDELTILRGSSNANENPLVMKKVRTEGTVNVKSLTTDGRLSIGHGNCSVVPSLSAFIGVEYIEQMKMNETYFNMDQSDEIATSVDENCPIDSNCGLSNSSFNSTTSSTKNKCILS